MIFDDRLSFSPSAAVGGERIENNCDYVEERLDCYHSAEAKPELLGEKFYNKR